MPLSATIAMFAPDMYVPQYTCLIFQVFFSRGKTKPMISRNAMIYHKTVKNSLPYVPAPSSALWPKAKSVVFGFVCHKILFLYVKLNKTNFFLISHPPPPWKGALLKYK